MSFSINQMSQLANKFSKVGWDELRVTQLGQANARKYRAIEGILDGKSLEEAIKTALLVRGVGADTTHLRFLQSATIAPTIGSTTLAQAGDVFTGYLDSDFKSWGTDVAGIDTEESPVDIHEMKQNGTFAQLFGSLSADPRSLCLTQGQIVEFARTHRALLRQDGYATLFLFEVNGELFVAYVRVDGGGLEAHVHRFSFGHVSYAGHRRRVVVAQQTL